MDINCTEETEYLDGAGLCIYVRSQINVNMIDVPSNLIPEAKLLWINFRLHCTDYFLASVYHPNKPSYNLDCIRNALTLDIDYIHSLPCNPLVIIRGDLTVLIVNFMFIILECIMCLLDPHMANNVLDRYYVSQKSKQSIKLSCYMRAVVK